MNDIQLPPNPIPEGPVYDEKLEREVGNIIGRNSERVSLPERETVWVIKDMSSLLIDLMDYINNINKNVK